MFVIEGKNTNIVNLNNYPGILPFKLGKAKIQSDQLSIIQVYNLGTLVTEFYRLKSFNNKFIETLKLVEYDVAKQQLINIENKIELQIYQLYPNNKRNKRGILNPLGTVIKCITGNLDSTDAERYEKLITELQLNQNKLKNISIKQITLMQKSIENFNELISNISRNQDNIRTKVIYLEDQLKRILNKDNEEKRYFQNMIIINEMYSIFQNIYDIFEKIEVAISFAKINVLHNSIVNPIELLKEIENYKNKINQDIFPLEIKIENILNFEKIIEIKSYSKDYTITFIMEIPLVEPDLYYYYKLLPLPIPTNNSDFSLIIPFKPYLALSDTKYAYMDEECQEIILQEYLCKKTHPLRLKGNEPCEVKLINFEQDTNNCHPFRIPIKSIQIERISDGRWIITTPHKTLATLKCNNEKENVPLYGTYLIEATPFCEIHLEKFILKTHRSSNTLFEEILLPKLKTNMSFAEEDIIFNPPVWNLNVINMKNNQDIKKELEEQRLSLSSLNNISVKRLSIWTILIYILLILLSLLFTYKYFKNKTRIVVKNDNDDIII